MEIADMVVINKYDSEYKKACERLRRSIKSSITLYRNKHINDFNWLPPVELVSAAENINVESIW